MRTSLICLSASFSTFNQNTDYVLSVQAWNYRRYVLASLPPPPASSPSQSAHTPASELAYTQRKIEANFSNFSAWHQRSKVYEKTGELGDKDLLDKEFNLVNQAMYTMPDDQSAWLYHRWLIAQSKCWF